MNRVFTMVIVFSVTADPKGFESLDRSYEFGPKNGCYCGIYE